MLLIMYGDVGGHMKMTGDNAACINNVLEYIEKHYSETISVDDAVALAKMSKSSFFREFKKTTNGTFFNYLNNYRVERAYELLKQTDKKIKTIADECGFASMQSMERLFKRKYGLLPIQVRKTDE